MNDDVPRSRQARLAAEQALVRVVHHYGLRPEFVLIGGLVPELLCSKSGFDHAGTTDVDVQVDLEIASGSVNAVRLEKALLSHTAQIAYAIHAAANLAVDMLFQDVLLCPGTASGSALAPKHCKL